MNTLLNIIFGNPEVFASLKSINNRHYYLAIPDNFCNKLVVLMHGATGDANSILNGDYSSQFILDLLDSGIGIILPNARKDFEPDTPYNPRWETETERNQDIELLNYFATKAKKIVYENWLNALLRKPIKVIMMGGSSGAIMATRAALTMPDKLAGIIVLNGVSAQCISIGDDGVKLNFDTSKINIPKNHPKVLSIIAQKDEVLPSYLQFIYAQKLEDAGIQSTIYTATDGEHSWGKWVRPFHSDIIGWIKAC